MIGERVAVLRRREAGRDEMGDAVWEWDAEEVSGCLVRPLSGSDVPDPLRPDGVVAEYSVALPKAYTATMRPLRGARIALVERGMGARDAEAALRVSGSPDRTVPCPTAWDVVATAGRSHG